MATYSKKQILEIDATRRALVGAFYDCDNGEVYIGTATRNLKLMQNSNNVVVNNTKSTVSNALESNSEEINTINLELQSDTLEGYTNLTYDSNGNITQKIVYLDSSLTVMKFVVTYGYTGDDLTEVLIKRVSDNFEYRKILTYDINGNLTNKNTIQ
jgi:hypothetical protein